MRSRNLGNTMQILKNKLLGLILICTFQFLISCSLTAPSYKVLMKDKKGIEVLLDSRRVNVTCEDASGDDKIHVLLVHVLNEKKLIDEYIYGMAYPKEICLDIKQRIKRVIKNGKQIYIGAHGDGKVDNDYPDPTQKHNFPELGDFTISRIFYGFQVIKNEKGQCMGFAYGDEKDGPCKKAGVDFLVGSPVSGY